MCDLWPVYGMQSGQRQLEREWHVKTHKIYIANHIKRHANAYCTDTFATNCGKYVGRVCSRATAHINMHAALFYGRCIMFV